MAFKCSKFIHSAYRAPELLFGTRTYDPIAIDLWSLGATFAEFFTPLRLSSDHPDDANYEDDDEEDDEEDLELPPDHSAASAIDPTPAGGDHSQVGATRIKTLRPFIVPKYLRIGYPGAQWTRESLFNGQRGEIGLAWSIFKILGTPTNDNWPVSLLTPVTSDDMTDCILMSCRNSTNFRDQNPSFSTSCPPFRWHLSCLIFHLLRSYFRLHHSRRHQTTHTLHWTSSQAFSHTPLHHVFLLHLHCDILGSNLGYPMTQNQP